MKRLSGWAILLSGALLLLAAWAQGTNFSVTNNGLSAFRFNAGPDNPTLQLQRGRSYSFSLNTPGHPFWIKTAQVTGGGSAYSSGVSGNGQTTGTLTFAVPQDAPDTLYYICGVHPGMTGTLQITNAPRDSDFDGDGRSDILWRNSSTGENYLYPMNGTAILGTEGYSRTVADLNWKVAGIGDFDGDGKADVLWRNSSTGENYVYLMNGTTIAGEGYLRTVASQNWQVAGVGDFNGDGRADILWRNASTGENYLYPMNGLAILGTEGYLRTVADLNWGVAGVGDFNGDGNADILWRNSTTGENYLYPMNGTAILGTEGYLRTVADLNWTIVGTGDFNGDGRDDILWRNSSTGENYMYPMNGTAILGTEGYLRTVADQNWKVQANGDYDGDGKADVLWRNSSTGENYLYFMDGTTIKPTEGYIRTVADQSWQVAAGPAVFPDNIWTTSLFAGTPGVSAVIDGTGAGASFGGPGEMTGDGTYLWMSDGSTVRRVTLATAEVVTVAGIPTPGAAVDDPIGPNARFRAPLSPAKAGNTVWIADTANGRIRAMSTVPPYAVTTVAGSVIGAVMDGAGAAAVLQDPRGLVHYGGFLYFTDAGGTVLRRFDPQTAQVVTIAGSPNQGGSVDGCAGAARFVSIRYAAADGAGRLYLSDTNGNRIRVFDIATGCVTNAVGTGATGYADGPIATAVVNRARGLAADAASIYWVESLQHTVRQAVLGAAVTTLAGSPLVGNTCIPASACPGGYANGVGTAALFNMPFSLVRDPGSGAMFVYDSGNSVIRRLE